MGILVELRVKSQDVLQHIKVLEKPKLNNYDRPIKHL